MSESKYLDSPYKEIPEDLKNCYTMNGRVPILDWWINGAGDQIHDANWSSDYVEKWCQTLSTDNIKKNGYNVGTPYGWPVLKNLIDCFEKYNIRNKTVAVVGSERPWIEAVLINMGNNVTTIEYNIPVCDHPKLECKGYFEFFEKNRDSFDAVISFSSIEHSGLGRYGDPLDPDGDIKTMKVIHNNLKKDGLFVWGAPVGQDAVVWNAHRIYGPTRLEKLFEDYKEIEWFGISKTDALNRPLGMRSFVQPVVMLQKL
jgi:hypothetical protein